MSKKKRALRFKAYLRKISKSPAMLQFSRDMATFQNMEWTDEAIKELFQDAADGIRALKHLGFDMSGITAIEGLI
jgi:hypothetical protein